MDACAIYIREPYRASMHARTHTWFIWHMDSNWLQLISICWMPVSPSNPKRQPLTLNNLFLMCNSFLLIY